MTAAERPAAEADRPSVPPRRLGPFDGVTVAAFVASLVFSWFLFGQGPLVPRLQNEFDASRSVASLHSVAFAVGTVGAALVMVPLLRRLRRAPAILLGTAGLVLAATAVVIGPGLGPGGMALTITGYGLGGGAGAVLATSVAALITARHEQSAGAVLSFIYGAGAVAGLLAPLAIGAGIALGLTWRPGFLVLVLLAAVAVAAVWWLRDEPLMRGGPGPRADDGGHGALPAMPRRFWIVLGVVMAGVCLEFFFTVWSGDLLLERTGLTAAAATASVSAVLAGMAAGRLTLSRTAPGRPPGSLLLVAAAVVVLGWTLVWLATAGVEGSPGLAVAGLLVAGLGIGGFYPLGTAWLVEESTGRPEAGLSWLALGTGLASGAAPFALGALADEIGVRAAFLLVPAIVAAAVLGLVALHARRTG